MSRGRGIVRRRRTQATRTPSGAGRHRAPTSTGRGPGARVLGFAAAGVLALCTLGATAGVYAAGGDDQSPAVILSKVMASDRADDGTVGTDASDVRQIDGGATDDGVADAVPAPAPVPQPPVQTPAPRVGPTPTPDPDPHVVPAPTPAPLDPSDPMSPEYNPYTTVGDPAYVADDEKAAWLGREAIVRACMADAGFEYLEWQWWLGGSPQPAGLSGDEAVAWSIALRGSPETDDGCRARAQREAEAAEAAGTPLSAPVPAPPGPNVPTAREDWLEFQSAVRSCMADLGLGYGYWEYWNPAYDSPDGSPAMPPGLDDDEAAAWNLAAFGDSSDTNAGGGCWATGLRVSGYRTFD